MATEAKVGKGSASRGREQNALGILGPVLTRSRPDPFFPTRRLPRVLLLFLFQPIRGAFQIQRLGMYSRVLITLNMEPGLSRGPGVGVKRAVPEVWCSSRSGSRSGEGVAVLRSLDDRLHSGLTLKPFCLRCSKEMLKLELE